MPTVNSIVSQANMVSQLSTKFFGTNQAAANNSVLVNPAQKSFANFLNSDFGGQPALTNLIKNYTDNRESFNDEMQENLNSLKESADKVKESAQAENVEGNAATTQVANITGDKTTGAALSTLGEFSNGNVPPELKNLANIPLQPKETHKVEQPAPKSNSLQDFAKTYLTAEKIKSDVLENLTNTSGNSKRVSEVQNLVHDFNSAISYLYENRSVSDRMSALLDKFGNNQNLAASLNSIGIASDSKGFLSLNEGIFNSALENNSELVNSIVGSEGLAGQLDKNINLANFQGDRLFTSFLDYANQRQSNETESLYGNNATHAVENTPRIFAMMT